MRDASPAADLVMRWRWLLPVTLLLIGLGGAAVKRVGLWPRDAAPKAMDIARGDADCDLRWSACAATFVTGERVELTIAPRGIPPMTPLKLRLTRTAAPGSDRPAAQRVEVDFVGVEMNMGVNRVTLEPAPQPHAHAAHPYVGSGMLPICVSSRMTWEARVLLHDATGTRAALFRFVTER